MARKLRVQFPGAIYHVMNRGDRREPIFRDDGDRESFVATIGDTCGKTGWQVHAFCLMPNHFHLVVETPQPNLAAGMKWLLGTYTTRFNHRHQVIGHLFAGRYKALLVGGEGGYLRTVGDYVHLNPARARLLEPDERLRDYPWSSLGFYLRPPAERPAWLRVDRLLGECGIARDDAAGRHRLEAYLESRRAQESEQEFDPLRHGWCLGSEEFRQEMLAQIGDTEGKHHFGRELQEAADAKANRIVDEELRGAHWTEADLRRRRKGDPEKIGIARRLRTETTVTLEWIAARLHMGSRSHLNHLLYWQRRAERDGTTPPKPGRTAGPRVRPAGTTARSPTSVTRADSRPSAPLPDLKPAPSLNPNPTQPMTAADGNTTILLTDPAGFDARFD